jgi:glucokinase
MSRLLFIGVDVGGTTTKGGVVDDTGSPLSAVSLPTEAHRGQVHGLEMMCETVRRAATTAGTSLAEIAAIGVATPGTLDIPAGVILDPFNLRPWQNVPVRRHIESVFNKPVAFQNDANAAAYGEYWVGAGRGTSSMVLFTLGTGVGGGIVIDDRIIEGRHSHGAELGHIRIELTNPRSCACGQAGCLEAYASAPSVVKRMLAAMNAEPGRSSLDEVVRQQGEVSSRDIFAAAAAGDELAEKVVEETAFYLAVGATNVMHTLDPDMIVFGGGMIAAGDSFLDRIRRHVRTLAFPVPAANTQIRFAELGTDAGFIGAAGCARQLFQQMGHERGRVDVSGT